MQRQEALCILTKSLDWHTSIWIELNKRSPVFFQRTIAYFALTSVWAVIWLLVPSKRKKMRTNKSQCLANLTEAPSVQLKISLMESPNYCRKILRGWTTLLTLSQPSYLKEHAGVKKNLNLTWKDLYLPTNEKIYENLSNSILSL